MSLSMLDAAIAARNLAYAPYSHFLVGCCIKSNSGQLYSGCNIENASYGLTLCAEGSAIAAMLMAGEKEIVEITVISSGTKICTPCGACRQRIHEFASPATLVHMYSTDGKYQSCSFHELLPFSFDLDGQ